MKTFWVAALALAGAAVAAGCSAGTSTPPPGSPASPTRSTPPPPTDRIGRVTPTSNGLTVRYRAADGSLKTLPVEDFPH